MRLQSLDGSGNDSSPSTGGTRMINHLIISGCAESHVPTGHMWRRDATGVRGAY